MAMTACSLKCLLALCAPATEWRSRRARPRACGLPQHSSIHSPFTDSQQCGLQSTQSRTGTRPRGLPRSSRPSGAQSALHFTPGHCVQLKAKPRPHPSQLACCAHFAARHLPRPCRGSPPSVCSASVPLKKGLSAPSHPEPRSRISSSAWLRPMSVRPIVQILISGLLISCGLSSSSAPSRACARAAGGRSTRAVCAWRSRPLGRKSSRHARWHGVAHAAHSPHLPHKVDGRVEQHPERGHVGRHDGHGQEHGPLARVRGRVLSEADALAHGLLCGAPRGARACGGCARGRAITACAPQRVPPTPSPLRPPPPAPSPTHTHAHAYAHALLTCILQHHVRISALYALGARQVRGGDEAIVVQVCVVGLHGTWARHQKPRGAQESGRAAQGSNTRHAAHPPMSLNAARAAPISRVVMQQLYSSLRRTAACGAHGVHAVRVACHRPGTSL